MSLVKARLWIRETFEPGSRPRMADVIEWIESEAIPGKVIAGEAYVDKLHWRGGWLIAVPPQNTSRTCPCCGHVSAENRKTQAGFVCVECGFEENADVVGAINVLRAGHARFACEVSDAAGSPAAGTHRSDSRAAQCRA